MMSLLILFGKQLTHFGYAIGFFCEIILAILVLFVLWGQWTSIGVYLVGFGINTILNRILKSTFKDPRPDKPVRFLADEDFNHSLQEPGNYYGMPSGHSQNAFYSISFLYFSLTKWWPWVAVSLSISAFMFFERWAFRNHSIDQLIVGALVGSVIGYGAVSLRQTIH
jgi:membrane-associated phospholipid phosphatase